MKNTQVRDLKPGAVVTYSGGGCVDFVVSISISASPHGDIVHLTRLRVYSSTGDVSFWTTDLNSECSYDSRATVIFPPEPETRRGCHDDGRNA